MFHIVPQNLKQPGIYQIKDGLPEFGVIGQKKCDLKTKEFIATFQPPYKNTPIPWYCHQSQVASVCCTFAGCSTLVIAHLLLCSKTS